MHVEWLVSQMEPARPALHDDALELLKTLGDAASAGGDRFRYRPIPGYPFFWLFHPGLPDGLSVAAYASLVALERADLVRFEPPENGFRPIHFVLTCKGSECYSRIMGGDSPSQHPPDDGSTLRD